MVQDFFDLEAIPSDTDYRMYSYKHGYGNLPGVDIATILDAEAYHTDRDASHRIRNGTLQARQLPNTDCSFMGCIAQILIITSVAGGDLQILLGFISIQFWIEQPVNVQLNPWPSQDCRAS